MAFRRYAKKFARVAGRAIRKRYVKRGKLNLKRVVKDVQLIKSMVNAEKKRYLINNTSNQPLGQVSGNTNGYLALDLTPSPAQGIGYNQRTGASIKLHSSYFQFQVYDQTSATSPIKVKFILVKVNGQIQNASTALTQFYSPNPFIGGASIYDLNSQRNPDYMKQYTVIRQWSRTIAADSYSGQRTIRDISVPIKYRGFHTRWSQDSANVTAGQLLLFIVCDNGNSSAVTSSTLTNVPNTAVNTGLSINYNLLHYFYDN